MSACGFQGSSTINIDFDSGDSHYRCGHLAMTYTGLCILLALGDDLSRVNRKALIEGTIFNTALYSRCVFYVWIPWYR